MKALNLLDAILKHPTVFQPCFHGKAVELTADAVEHMFKYDLSPEGSNKRANEANTVAFWLDLLLDIQGMSIVNLVILVILVNLVISCFESGCCYNQWIDNFVFGVIV